MSVTRYGIDAPGTVRRLSVLALTSAAVGIIALSVFHGVGAIVVGVLVLIYAGVTGIEAVLRWYTSTRGKAKLFAAELATADIPANADVLDLGPGTGQLLAVLGRQLPGRGRIVGIDLWRAVDQSGNTFGATEANMQAEGLGDRVELVTGDFQQLPFTDGSFDLVCATLAIHNLDDRKAQKHTLQEAARVLRPGGHLLIIDIAAMLDYASVLDTLPEFEGVRVSPTRFGLVPKLAVVHAQRSRSLCRATQ